MAKNKISPATLCVWPWLTKPKTKFDEQGEYTVDLVFDQDHDFVKRVEKAANKAFEKTKSEMKPTQAKKLSLNLPVKDEVDTEGNETGNVLITFKTKAYKKDKKTGTITPKSMTICDASGKPIKGELPNIGSGSKLAVAFNPSGRAVNGRFYYTLYLNAVQLIELVEFGGNPGFESHEGGFEAADDAESEFDKQAAGGTDADEDDDF